MHRIGNYTAVFGAGDPGTTDPSKWRRLNLLGNTLMRVRDVLDPRHSF